MGKVHGPPSYKQGRDGKGKGRMGKGERVIEREGDSGRGREGTERGGTARLKYLSRAPQFLVTPPTIAPTHGIVHIANESCSTERTRRHPQNRKCTKYSTVARRGLRSTGGMHRKSDSLVSFLRYASRQTGTQTAILCAFYRRGTGNGRIDGIKFGLRPPKFRRHFTARTSGVSDRTFGCTYGLRCQ